jgi:hypothetical protein
MRCQHRDDDTDANSSAASRNVTTPRNLPASSTRRRGCRTRSWRSVPRLYSLAACAAAMPNATTPSSIVALVTPRIRPFGLASCCSDGRPPPSPVAGAWLNTRITNKEAAAARPMNVDNSRDLRFSFVHSLVNAAQVI